MNFVNKIQSCNSLTDLNNRELFSEILNFCCSQWIQQENRAPEKDFSCTPQQLILGSIKIPIDELTVCALIF